MTNLEVQLAGLTLQTPIVGASGTFGYGLEYDGLVDYRSYGAVVAKTVTLEPRSGNPPPRIADLGHGMLNAIGLENVGLEAFLGDKLPKVTLPCHFFASIGGETADEYRRLAAVLGRAPRVAALEANVSCPNVARGGLALGGDPRITRDVVRAIRAETSLPLIAKLPPLITGLGDVAEAACEGGADALVVANTYPAMAMDLARERPALGSTSGGMSGRAIRPISLLLVWQVVEKVKVPVIASGGIERGEDALEYLLAGATAFEIGSVILRDLSAAAKILAGISVFMQSKGYTKIEDLRGRARRQA
ncbi:MAG TPA: dihydroorotate dehydrogenase [bacterium]|nr:dihydroorotate dehydrogenase [bacterium]